MKTNEQLLNNIIGQLHGVNKMLEQKQDCFAVLNQMKAARATFNKLINNYLSAEILRCLKTCSQDNNHCKEVLSELVKNK